MRYPDFATGKRKSSPAGGRGLQERKNYPFTGSDRGAQRAAVIYLRDALERLQPTAAATPASSPRGGMWLAVRLR